MRTVAAVKFTDQLTQNTEIPSPVLRDLSNSKWSLITSIAIADLIFLRGEVPQTKPEALALWPWLSCVEPFAYFKFAGGKEDWQRPGAIVRPGLPGAPQALHPARITNEVKVYYRDASEPAPLVVAESLDIGGRTLPDGSVVRVAHWRPLPKDDPRWGSLLYATGVKQEDVGEATIALAGKYGFPTLGSSESFQSARFSRPVVQQHSLEGASLDWNQQAMAELASITQAQPEPTFQAAVRQPAPAPMTGMQGVPVDNDMLAQWAAVSSEAR